MSTFLQEWYDSPPPRPPRGDEPVVYHYTDAAGVYGILSSGNLWATSARYLNDSSEIRGAFDMAADVADRHPAGSDASVREGLRSFANYVRDSGGISPNVVIVSLSEEGDLLSQWRGYGDYAVGLNWNALRAHLSDGMRFMKCNYNWTEHRSLIESAITEAVRAASTVEAQQGVSFAYHLHNNIYTRMIELAPMLKHPSFAEEREWRIVAGPLDGRTLKTRPGRYSLVQYAEIALPQNVGRIIERIVIGPSAHQRLKMQGVGDLTMTVPAHMTPGSISLSPTPYLP